MKFNIHQSFFKIFLKFFKKYYFLKQKKWGSVNLNESLFFLSFDFETQRDIDLLEQLTKMLIDVKIRPYYAIPGYLIEENREILQKYDKKITIINHGYSIHTKFCKKTNQNFSSLSYLNLNPKEIEEDILKGHDIIRSICNQNPKIFRTPHFGEFCENSNMNFIYKILKKKKYTHSSSTTPIFSITNSPIFCKNDIFEMPSSAYLNNPLQIIDSWSISNSNLCYKDLYLELMNFYKLMQNYNFFLNIYFDPSDIINETKIFKVFSKLSKFQKKIEDVKVFK